MSNTKLRYSVYSRTYERNNLLVERKFIVLKKRNYIVSWTNYGDYITLKNKQHDIQSNPGKAYECVSKFLNYIFYDNYHICKISDLKAEMAINFIKDVGLCRLKTDGPRTSRQKDTVKLYFYTIIGFLNELQNKKIINIDSKKLWHTEKFYNYASHRFDTKTKTSFEIEYISKNKRVFRDLPGATFSILFNHTINNHPSILMIFALCAFAGLRPSEACNVRRVDSLLGPGMIFTLQNGVVTDIEIDITKELKLRSDNVNVGKIKKHRVAKVYYDFIHEFCYCYDLYMKNIDGKKYEAEYGPLSISRDGKALTYNSFLYEFKKIVNECIPIMLKSDDPTVVNYGLLLQENSLSPHCLRHWFSVQLCINNEEDIVIQDYRGDKSPESVLTYLSHKEDLRKLYKSTTNKVGDYLIWASNKMYGKN